MFLQKPWTDKPKHFHAVLLHIRLLTCFLAHTRKETVKRLQSSTTPLAANKPAQCSLNFVFYSAADRLQVISSAIRSSS